MTCERGHPPVYLLLATRCARSLLFYHSFSFSDKKGHDLSIFIRASIWYFTERLLRLTHTVFVYHGGCCLAVIVRSRLYVLKHPW